MKDRDKQRIKKMKQLKIDEFFDLGLDLNCVSTIDGQLLIVNKSWEEVTGYRQEELEGRMILDYIHPEEAVKIREIIGKLKEDNKSRLNLTTRFRCLNGDYKVFEWSLFIHDNNVYGSARVCFKYDQRCKKNNEVPIEGLIAHERQLFRTVLLSIGDAIISIDENGQIFLMNKVAEKLTGWSLEEAQGKYLTEVYRIEEDKTREIFSDFVGEVIKSGEPIEIEEVSLIQKDGKTIYVEDSMAPIKDQQGEIIGAVLAFRDFTEKRERLKQVEYLSFHDHLTGLYNRRYMEDALRRLDQKRNLPLTLMVMDINGLKLVNDSFGHKLGDQLIIKVAELLKKVCRADDIIARIGGDEFGVILPQTTAKEAEAIKKRIISEAQLSAFKSVIVSVAVGYGVKLKEEDDLQTVFKWADEDMYRHKFVSGKSMRTKTIERILRILSKNYEQEGQHAQAVAFYAEKIAGALKLKLNERHQVKAAAILHDIGKINISPQLLSKKSLLSDEEMQTIQKHSQTGYQILKEVEEYTSLADVVLYHHERWDGRGYPKGLKGEEIPQWARIIAVADAYEAMTAGRAYQVKKTRDQALEELEKCAGTQFDPEIVAVFIGAIEKD